MTNVQQKVLKPKYFKKAIMRTKKVNFSSQTDKETGEIIYKSLQSTLYVVDGDDSPYLPKIGLSLKLGNDRIATFFDSMDEIERFLNDLQAQMSAEGPAVTKTLIKEKDKYYKRLNAITRSKNDELR